MTSTPESTNGSNGAVRTLGVRLPAGLHAQLSLMAQLRGTSITGEILEAIETHINSVKANPELAGKADSVLEDIEREAAARREAIATLFGSDTDDAKQAPRSRTKRGDSPPAR